MMRKKGCRGETRCVEESQILIGEDVDRKEEVRSVFRAVGGENFHTISYNSFLIIETAVQTNQL